MSDIYEAVLEELRGNREQWAALETRAHCVTLAGPGSGKTKVLTAKMARVLREDVRPPRSVACLTYNNECARELERRLRLLGVAESPNVYVGTLHGFCLRHVLSPFSHLVGIDVPHPLLIASERAQARHFSMAMENVGVDAQGLRTDVDRFRRTAIDRIEGVDGWEMGDRGLTDVTLEYERLLRASGHVDFDDIIILSVRAIETSAVLRRCLRARFQVLLVDEYQDLGTPLHRMVMKLCFDGGIRLFAVGDPDQSIYGFTGARPELLRQLAQRDDVDRVELRMNYRSGRRIVAASELALGQPRNYRAHSAEDGVVEFTHLPGGLAAQVRHAVQTVVPSLIESGDPAGSIAVLYPTKQEGDACEAGLISAGIPYVRLDRGSGYRRTPLVRLIEDLAAWCCGGWRKGTPPLSSLLGKWRSLNPAGSEAEVRAARGTLVRFLFAHRDPGGRIHEWLELFSRDVLGGNGRGALSDDEKEAVDELLVATGPNGALCELEAWMFAGKSDSPDHVCLMNLHTAKGSEFNAVVLVGMDEGRMPSYRASAGEALAEQRRLFFVGLSRARREVHVLYSGFTENAYGRRFDTGPSRFVVELQEKLRTAGGATPPRTTPRPSR